MTGGTKCEKIKAAVFSFGKKCNVVSFYFGIHSKAKAMRVEMVFFFAIYLAPLHRKQQFPLKAKHPLFSKKKSALHTLVFVFTFRISSWQIKIAL